MNDKAYRVYNIIIDTIIILLYGMALTFNEYSDVNIYLAAGFVVVGALLLNHNIKSLFKSLEPKIVVDVKRNF